MKHFMTHQMAKISGVARRFATFVNPPSIPGYSSSMPRVRDYPVARPTQHPR
jgi:hypothetical protein